MSLKQRLYEKFNLKPVLNLKVMIAGLGYFVDLFDITLFGVVRVNSLKDLGLTEATAILQTGVFIYNLQMLGMIVGGILWGILADRKGRLSVLFASILLYSLANLANVFVTSTTAYAVCRFLGGLGLAGELGAAVTLVAETLPVEKRGLGTTIVATLGMLGVLTAAIVGQWVAWRFAYAIGGLLGIGLLLTRLNLNESSMFLKLKKEKTRGNALLLFKRRRLLKYVACIAAGIPIYFTTGVLFTFAPELASGLGVVGNVSAGQAILFGSIGLTLGDLLCGLFSQALRSRKRAVTLSLGLGYVLLLIYCLTPRLSPEMIYTLSFFIGITVGYWAVLITMATEQFGTEIRGTVSTTVPNFVRGSAIFATTAFAYLKFQMLPAHAAWLVGTICFGIAMISVFFLEETFTRDLNFREAPEQKSVRTPDRTPKIGKA